MLGRTARAGTTLTASASVAGLVYGVLQLVEDSVGDFQPRATVKLLIAATMFILSLALGRVRVVASRRQARDDRDRQLDEDLAVWPLETVGKIDPYYLGVFPLPTKRGEDRSLGAYVARDADDEIEAAMRTEPFVLVFGPARAGKSRTAYEAARRVLSDAWVIVPEGPEELRTLMNVDPPLNFGHSIGVIWLDDLDRFAPSLDLDLMDALGGKRQRLQMVATIREDAYEAMLEAGGQEGETARRVLTRARGIELPAKLSAGEEKAAAVLPQRRRGTPLGADTAEILSGGHMPADRPRGASSVTLVTTAIPAETSPRWQRWLPGPIRDDLKARRERRRAEQDLRDATQKRRKDLEARGVEEGTDVFPRRFTLDVPLVLTVLALAVSGALLGYAISDKFEQEPPASLDDQVNDAMNALKPRAAWRAARRTVMFRGEGQSSYFITYTPKTDRESSEIRVYDQSRSKLQLKFRFRPDPELRGDGTKVGWRFFIRNRTVDVDDSGGADVVGAFRPADDPPGRVLPVVIYADEDGYQLKGLGRTVSGRASAKPGKRVDLTQADPPREPNLLPVHIGPTYEVADFTVARVNDAPKFIVGQFARKPRSFTPNEVIVHAWRLGAKDMKPYLGVPCRLVESDGAGVAPGQDITFRSPADSLWPSILARWTRADRHASCRLRR